MDNNDNPNCIPIRGRGTFRGRGRGLFGVVNIENNLGFGSFNDDWSMAGPGGEFQMMRPMSDPFFEEGFNDFNMIPPNFRGRFNNIRGQRGVRGRGRGRGRGLGGPGMDFHQFMNGGGNAPVINPMFVGQCQRGWGTKFVKTPDRGKRGGAIKRPAPAPTNVVTQKINENQNSVGGAPATANPTPEHNNISKPLKAAPNISPAPSVPVQDMNQGHSQDDIQGFFSRSLRGMNPTGWVTEMARRKGWFVHGLEGSEGKFPKQLFNYSLKLNTLASVGYGTKKKDAKNISFRIMAIKLGEEFGMLPPLSKPSAEPPKEKTVSVAVKPNKPSASNSEVNPSIGQTATAPVICNPNTLATSKPPTDGAPVPDGIQHFSAGQMVTIPGHPVVALSDLCKKLHYGGPQYVCVKEEKVAKIGIYWKFDFTTRVTICRGQETRIFYGKAATKKDSKNQAAAAGYFGLAGPRHEAGGSQISTLGTEVGGRQISVLGTEAGGRQISVLGSAVPLPAPPILPTTLVMPAKIIPVAQIKPTNVISTASVVSAAGTSTVSSSSRPQSASVTAASSMNLTPTASQNHIQTTNSQPKTVPPVSSNSNKSQKKEPTLDDCLHDFENFLSGLEADVNKRAKTSATAQSSRSRRKTRSASRSRSRSRRRSRSRSGYRSRHRRSRSRSGSYDRRYRSRSRERESRYRGRDRERSVERYNSSRHYDDYYDDYDVTQRRMEDRRGRY